MSGALQERTVDDNELKDIVLIIADEVSMLKRRELGQSKKHLQRLTGQPTSSNDITGGVDGLLLVGNFVQAEKALSG